MANNNNKNQTGANLAEISTIRDILMGQQINQYEENFQRIQDEIENLRTELEEKLKAVDHFHKFAMIDFSKETNQRFNKVEKNLAKQVENLENKIRSSSTADKKELGRMMTNIGKKLMGE
ncbi:MAG: hypothetical protein AB8F74_17380 [Saprospiraceae bacterium]